MTSLPPEFMRLVKLAQESPKRALRELNGLKRTHRTRPRSQRYLEGSLAAMIRTAAEDHVGARREWLALAEESEAAQRLYQVALTYSAEGKQATARRILALAKRAISAKTDKQVRDAILQGLVGGSSDKR